MEKVSLDTCIQLLGMLGLIGGLVFVDLEMRQSQIIALAAQQQSRTEDFTTILNAFSESGPASVYQVATKVCQNEPLTPAKETLAQNFAHQTVLIFENDFTQYKVGLMDEDVWKAKLTSIREIANSFVYSDVVRFAIGFMTSELQDFIDFPENLHCPDSQPL